MVDMREALKARSSPFVAAVVAVVLAACLIFVYRLSQQVERLHVRLKASEAREQRLAERIDDAGDRLREFRIRAEEATARAQTESERARAAQIEKDLADWERELARQRAEEAERRADEALTEAERSRQEYDRIRTARERELDRMQDALSRIVETERTSIGMVMQLSEDSLQFDFDEATIREEDKELLSRIAGVLLASHGYQLYIYGHTDDQGGARYNEKLSLRRARAVMEYFADAGVPQELMQAEGFGERDPRAPGTSPEARQKNRRVEIGVVDTVIDYEDIPPASVSEAASRE